MSTEQWKAGWEDARNWAGEFGETIARLKEGKEVVGVEEKAWLIKELIVPGYFVVPNCLEMYGGAELHGVEEVTCNTSIKGMKEEFGMTWWGHGEGSFKEIFPSLRTLHILGKVYRTDHFIDSIPSLTTFTLTNSLMNTLPIPNEPVAWEVLVLENSRDDYGDGCQNLADPKLPVTEWGQYVDSIIPQLVAFFCHYNELNVWGRQLKNPWYRLSSSLLAKTLFDVPTHSLDNETIVPGLRHMRIRAVGDPRHHGISFLRGTHEQVILRPNNEWIEGLPFPTMKRRLELGKRELREVDRFIKEVTRSSNPREPSLETIYLDSSVLERHKEKVKLWRELLGPRGIKLVFEGQAKESTGSQVSDSFVLEMKERKQEKGKEQ
ncbi:hypothetical protein JCM5353_008032 [Sporobolomyces roseus]